MNHRRFVAALAVAVAGTASCARPYPPGGGEPDRTAPQVVGTMPATMAVEPQWSEPVVIRFDERISEKGVETAVLVSPETGRVRVRKGGSHLSVSIEGGWRPGQIYRVVVLPVLQDLFGNKNDSEIEVIFSTGPEIPATVAAGMVTDRITGRPVPAARVEALRRADSVVYVAVSDSAGFFALRHIPPGGYDLVAYLDQSRNRTPEFGEAQAADAVELGAADTTITTFSLLPNDSTPARLVRAESGDSLQVRLFLDDHVDAAETLDGVEARLWHLPDSVAVGIAHLFHPHAHDAWLAERQAAALPPDTPAADSVAAKGVAADSSGAGREVADSAGARPGGDGRFPGRQDAGGAAGAAGAPSGPAGPAGRPVGGTAGGRLGPDGEPLPTRELVIVPAAPLAPREQYRVELRGIRNLRGLEGGGGSVTFTAPVPRPAPAAADTTGGAASDTIPPVVPPDTGAVR